MTDYEKAMISEIRKTRKALQTIASSLQGKNLQKESSANDIAIKIGQNLRQSLAQKKTDRLEA